ncbi:MAG TPA: hypothetical protein K8W13_09485 [Enterococcus columbae]|nr:hypothetical protein [Enterococcus columbae]
MNFIQKGKLMTAFFAFLLTMILFYNANNPTVQSNLQKSNYSYSETIKSVPIVFDYDDEKYYIQGYEPTVSVKLTSVNRVQLLAESNEDTRTFRVVAHLKKLKPGTHEVSLEVENLKSGVKAKLTPKKTLLTIENKQSKTFNVEAAVAENSLKSGVEIESVTTTPKRIVVTTGEETMKEISAVRAIVTSTTPIEENLTKSVKLFAINKKGEQLDVTFSQPKVEVHVKLKPQIKVLPIKIKQTGTMPDTVSGYSFSVAPTQVTLTGYPIELAKLNEIELPVDITGIAEKVSKVYNIPIASRYESDQKNVTVTITPTLKASTTQSNQATTTITPSKQNNNNQVAENSSSTSESASKSEEKTDTTESTVESTPPKEEGNTDKEKS